jgi:hypothetical protein
MRASRGSRQLDSVSSTSVPIQARKSFHPLLPPKVEYTLEIRIALGSSPRRSSKGPKSGGKYREMSHPGNGAGSFWSPVGLFELMVTRLRLSPRFPVLRTGFPVLRTGSTRPTYVSHDDPPGAPAVLWLAGLVIAQQQSGFRASTSAAGVVQVVELFISRAT